MADAITALWHGNNYQSRFFWLNALDLLRPETCVAEVTFEASGPKAFDDVVVYYDPPVVRSGPERIVAEYHQVKWHTTAGGRFGYKDLIEPSFIGASSYSLLERLRDAKQSSLGPARFILVTTDRVADGDSLAKLISSNDSSLLLEKLFDGTTDRSKMGKVRKCWREHLQISNDDELSLVLDGLSIVEGYKTEQQLREEINLRAEVVGLLSLSATESAFRYDELARQLKVRSINSMTRESLVQISKAEGLWVGSPVVSNQFLPIAIRSFIGLSTDLVPAAQENTLLLTDSFRSRYLNDDRDWTKDILPRVGEFLRVMAHKSNYLKLILDAHASIAYLSGSILNLKSGLRVDLVQKGRIGARVWDADDGTSGDTLVSAVEALNCGREIALAVSITQSVGGHVLRYIERELPDIGRLISLTPPNGPGQSRVSGGAHAANMAEQASNLIRDFKADEADAVVHLFAACPNSLLFYLGQNHQAIGPIIVYEFDFDREGNKSYQPSFLIP